MGAGYECFGWQCYYILVNRYSGNNTFAISFSGTATLNCMAPLPISLLSFSCETKTTAIEISWVTASEINNDYFTIERSTDGMVWENIGTVDSKAMGGNSTEVLNYSYADSTPHNGINYYRLKQTDHDGGTETFQITACEYEPKEVTMNIYTVTGQLIASMITSDYRKTFAQANLASGVYIIELNNVFIREFKQQQEK